MIFARILLVVLALNTASALAVDRLYIGKVDRVSDVVTLVGTGKTRQSAEANLEFKRKIVLAQQRIDAEKTSGLGRSNFSMRLLAYEAKALPSSYRHLTETPGDVTITEKFVVRSSYNVLTSRPTAEAKMELTSAMIWVISGTDIPVYETTVNMSAFTLGNEGYKLTLQLGQYLRSDVLSASQYIDRKKLKLKLLIASDNEQDQNGVREIMIDDRESAEILNLKVQSRVSRAISFCAGLVGG